MKKYIIISFLNDKCEYIPYNDKGYFNVEDLTKNNLKNYPPFLFSEEDIKTFSYYSGEFYIEYNEDWDTLYKNIQELLLLKEII